MLNYNLILDRTKTTKQFTEFKEADKVWTAEQATQVVKVDRVMDQDLEAVQVEAWGDKVWWTTLAVNLVETRTQIKVLTIIQWIDDFK